MRRELIIGCLLGMSLISGVVEPSMADGIQADLLLYGVTQANGDEVTNRMLVSHGKLRIDQAEQADGYILYDAEAGSIYSLTREERSILVIQPKGETPRIPDSVELKMERIDDFDGPEIGGSKPQHWRLSVNGEICRDAILAPGLMTDALAIYRDYLSLLAKQHYLSLDAIPAEYRDPCDDAIHVYAPALLLQWGLPIRLWDQSGHQERLLDFTRQKRVSADLFGLPEDYQRLPMRPADP